MVYVCVDATRLVLLTRLAAGIGGIAVDVLCGGLNDNLRLLRPNNEQRYVLFQCLTRMA